MKTILETIPHQSHRYDTVGDWYYATYLNCTTCFWSRQKFTDDTPDCPGCHRPMAEEKVRVIRVSALGDERFEELIKLHEYVEVLKCEHDGVTQEQVDKFDTEFEANRKEGNEDEPGDDPNAPYCQQHSLATAVERLMAVALEVKWEDYAAALEALPDWKPA